MGVSRRAGDFIMGLLWVIVDLLSWDSGGNIGAIQKRTLEQLPRSINDALSRFNLEGRTTIYAVCPACHCTYAPEGSAERRVYPNLCTNRPEPDGEVCNEPLLNGTPDGSSSNELKPIKVFVYHHFADYLAGLLSRYEHIMDKATDDCARSLDQPLPELVTDFFDAEFVRTFPGPEPNTLFVQRPGTEGRYLFVANIDFFNVEGMRIRGPSISNGIIALACLNLPLEIRYKPENMHLAGIIPRDEPKLDQINHYVRPLVDDLETSYEKGIRISRTQQYPKGRDTRSAVAAVVNDLPGARKAAGLAAFSSHFYCSVCDCHHISTRGRTDVEMWKLRDHLEMRKQAEAWRDASTSAERVNILKNYGVRWSEFWRLRYWNPIRQLVADPMHCLLEGLARFQARVLLCLDSVEAGAKPQVVPAFSHDFAQVPQSMPPKEVKQVLAIQALLVQPIQDGNLGDNIDESLQQLSRKLFARNKNPLHFVVDSLGLETTPDPRRASKAGLVAALIEWVTIISLLN
jgi:hypothetical protein